MTEDKKRWAPVYFPEGIPAEPINVEIKTEHVLTAQEANEVISECEIAHASKNSRYWCAYSKGTPKIQSAGEVCEDLHPGKDA